MMTTVIKMIMIDLMVRILLANVTWKRPWLNKLHKVFPGPPPENRLVTTKDTNIHDKSSTSSPKTSEYHKKSDKTNKSYELFKVWRLYTENDNNEFPEKMKLVICEVCLKINHRLDFILEKGWNVSPFFSAKVYTLYPSVMGGYGQQPEQTGAGKVLLYT